MESSNGDRVVRLILRRPEAAAQVEDLAAIPHSFDALFNKPYYAHQLRLAGHDWPVIASKLKYGSSRAAERAVHSWLRKTVETRASDFPVTRAQLLAEAVALDLDRLDRLQAAYWEEAIGGDIPSALLCLKVIAQRASLRPSESVPSGITNQINTLVVGGTEAEYVGALIQARNSITGPAHKVIEQVPDDEPDVVD